MRLACVLAPLLLTACGDFAFNVHTDPKPPPDPAPSTEHAAPAEPVPSVDDAGIGPTPGDVAI